MVKGSSLKILIPLAIAASVTTVVLYQRQELSSGGRFEPRKLLPDLDIGTIRRIEIDAGGEPFALTGSGEAWHLESLPGFPVDPEPLRELVLTLGALEASERMTDKPENYERLGVQDADPATGHVKLIGEADKVLAEVFVGEERSGRPSAPGGFGPAEGQYVRLAGDPRVYLVASQVAVAGDPSHWIEKELLKVAPEDLTMIRVDNADTTESFVLQRGPSGDFELQGGVPEDMQIQSWAVDNAGRALANFLLTNVKPAADAGVAFDGAFRATQKNGLVYRVETGASDEKFYARIGAEYDQTMNLGVSDERTSDTVAARAMEDPQAAAARLNERHGPWVYEISSFSHENLTRRRSSLMEPRREEIPAGGETPEFDDPAIEDFLSGLQQNAP